MSALPGIAGEGPALPLTALRPSGLEAALAALPAPLASFARAAGFEAKPGQALLLPGESGLAGALWGLGERDEGPWGFGGCPGALPAGTAWTLSGTAPDAALGWALGAYRFARYREAGRAPARLLAPAGSEAALIEAAATCRARDLINTPAADLGPAELAAAVRQVASETGAEYREIGGEALAEGFPAVHAVGQGSARPPRIAILSWGDPAHPLVALCGKGVCFDTGGLDLKPPAAMLRMKKDMGGAAILLALAETLIRSRAPLRVWLAVGAVENSVSGNAFRPGDVLRTRAGVSVEIGNTDAEGRLVLADLLALAGEQQPAVVLDAATLTGAARVALGPDLPALFCNEDGLAEAILAAGRNAHDPLWRLPLHDGYTNWLDSSVANMNNVSSKPMAGAVVAALFLRRFAPAGVPWAHVDVYAWNDSSRPGRPEGGEAQAMRALHLALRNRAPGLATAPKPII
jgi:leucyl aminopeptidase